VADIFFSYKHTRREIVKRLATILEAHGWSVWWDAQLREGERFREEITKELAAARCVVVLWCDQSINAGFVLDEAELALRNDALVPVLWMEVSIPLGFGQVQAVNLIGWERGIRQPIITLINSIERKIGHPGHPTRDPIGTVRRPEEAVSDDLPARVRQEIDQMRLEIMAEQTKYDLASLPSEVRYASEAARYAELEAVAAQIRGEYAAERAKAAAQRARAAEIGTKVHRFSDGREYAGEWSKRVPNGYGVLVYPGTHNLFAHDRYEGHWLGGKQSGAGTHFFSENANNTPGYSRYEGYWSDGSRHGVGCTTWRNGAVHRGREENGLKTGHGVYCEPGGLRFEGKFENSQRNGYGVSWSIYGHPIEAGKWDPEDSNLRLSIS
jgi:hypothetical protein